MTEETKDAPMEESEPEVPASPAAPDDEEDEEDPNSTAGNPPFETTSQATQREEYPVDYSE